MSLMNADLYLGKRLEECWAELHAVGGLSTWAPYSFDSRSIKRIELRFNNHWGTLIEEGYLEYLIMVTDEKGLITYLKAFPLKDLESCTIPLTERETHSNLGAVYFGCASPAALEWATDEHGAADYFYLAYECEDSYSVVHAQPFDADSRINSSSWPNCIQVSAEESPKILLGNPSIHPSSGYVRLQDLGSGRRIQFEMELKPFNVMKFNLDGVNDGWYAINCDVGKGYAHLIRSFDRGLTLRHM